MDETVQLWLEFANADLETASFLYEKQYPRQLEIICYHCQQAGEKAIKALYLAREIPGGIPRKHDLWFLLEQMKNTVKIPEIIYDAAEKLDPYAIVFRYPGENRVDDYRAKHATELAKAIVEWAKQIIESVAQLSELSKGEESVQADAGNQASNV